jgi:hypothetical protein
MKMSGGKGNYCFRLKFRMGTLLNLVSTPARLSLGSVPVQIATNAPRVPGTDQWIAIKSCGYGDLEGARAAALQLKDAILVAGAKGFAADFGIDRPISQLAHASKNLSKEQFGITIRDDVHGIDIYKNQAVRHFQFSATISVSMDANEFVKRIDDVAEVGRLTDRVRTGAEIINDSLFSLPAEARFLLRISAVEAMSPQAKCGGAVKQTIEALIAELSRVALEEGDRKVIADALNQAKRQSVRQACLSMVRLRLGEASARRFDELYKLRSKYVHEGEGRGRLLEAAEDSLKIGVELLTSS